MGAPLRQVPFLHANDPLWACRTTLEIASAAQDSDLAGLGGSPYVGDMGSTGVRVPAAATAATGVLAQQNRYLIRLCGVAVPTGSALIIHGIRQAATIRVALDENDEPVVIEREITSPLWRFRDGNISWHLKKIQTLFGPAPFDGAQAPGESTDMNALDSSLLYTPPRAPYRAPNLGKPPGKDISGLGTWRDMRFSWRRDGAYEDVNIYVRGGGSVVMYASVHQPDAGSRTWVLPDVDGMRPEDRFISNFIPQAIYGRVAGALIVELIPCCDETKTRPTQAHPGE